MNNQFVELEVEHKNPSSNYIFYTEYIVNINYITCIYKPFKNREISVTNGNREDVWTLSQRSFDNLLKSINISHFNGRRRK